MAKRKSAVETKAKASRVSNATYGNPIADWLRDSLVDSQSKQDTGVNVNRKTALGYAPVWSCVNKIAGHVGYLPVNFFEREAANPKRVKQVTNTVSYFAIACEPNAFMTAQTFKETLTGDAILEGNGRAYIVRDGNSQASEFIPLPADKTKTFLVKFDEANMRTEGGTQEAIAKPGGWEKWHVTTLPDGSKYFMPDYKVLHIPGLSYDGIQGYSVIDLARTAIGLGLAGERAAARNFKNGARPSFMVKAPPGLFTKQEEAKQFIEDFRKQHEGVENDGKIGLLRGGMELQTYQQSAQESQWNEQRKFQRQEMALLFAVEQILGDDSSVSYKSLEEKNRAYITNCLNRWLNKWEQELARKTLTVSQRRSMRYYYRFDDWELTRGTMQSRFAAYQVARQAEILSANECREYEDMAPREGGDTYSNPAINPQRGTGSQPAKPAEGNAKAAIASRIRHMVGIETKRLSQLAETPGRFLEAVEKFYLGWKDRMNIVVNELGGDAGIADEWIANSYHGVLTASGIAKENNLSAVITGEYKAWEPRIENLINTITEVANV